MSVAPHRAASRRAAGRSSNLARCLSVLVWVSAGRRGVRSPDARWRDAICGSRDRAGGGGLKCFTALSHISARKAWNASHSAFSLDELVLNSTRGQRGIVQVTAPVRRQHAIGRIMQKSMFERVFDPRKWTCFIQEFRRPANVPVPVAHHPAGTPRGLPGRADPPGCRPPRLTAGRACPSPAGGRFWTLIALRWSPGLKSQKPASRFDTPLAGRPGPRFRRAIARSPRETADCTPVFRMTSCFRGSSPAPPPTRE